MLSKLVIFVILYAFVVLLVESTKDDPNWQFRCRDNCYGKPIHFILNIIEDHSACVISKKNCFFFSENNKKLKELGRLYEDGENCWSKCEP